MRKGSFIAILFLVTQCCLAQNVFRDLKSLEKRGDQCYNEMSYMTAIDLYGQVLRKPKNADNYKIRIKIAKSYLRLGQTEEAEQYYRTALEKGFIPSRKDSTQFASILVMNNKHKEAKQWLNTTVNSESDPIGYKQLSSLDQLNKLYRDSFSFSAKPIIYNSEYSDYSPVYYRNGIVFSSDRPSEKLIRQVNMQKDAGFSDLYFFKLKDTAFRAAQPVSLDIKSNLHKGPVVFYEGGKKMIITSNMGKGSVNRLQMYMAEWDDKKSEWTNFKPFPFNSDFYSVGHPALSKDGRTLYFVSDMPGGNGGTDIYVSVLKDGEWSTPKNLREPINTEGNEMFPYISPMGKFYFSSNGHGGLGGLDFLYIDNAMANGQSIFNPGYPLNSSGDDFGIVLDEEERSGFFSSNRKGGKGQDDIYRLYIKRVELKVKVADEIATATVQNPKVSLVDKETQEEIKPIQQNSKENNVSYYLKPYHEYKLVVEKTDYKDFVKEISTVDINDDRVIELKATLKRKFEYYVTLKIRDQETENIVENSIIKLINVTSQEMDSIGLNPSGEADFKLDSEADYIVLAYKKNKYGQVLVEKQVKKKVSSVKYITVQLTDPEIKKVRLNVADSLGNKIPAGRNLIVRNMISGEEQGVVISGDSKIEFDLRGDWYYRVYYNDRKYFYDSLKKATVGNLKFVPE